MNVLLPTTTRRAAAHRPSMRSQRGFTFLELLIVMTILAILATVAIPVYLQNIKHARETRLIHDLWVMREAIDKYTVDKEKAPLSLQDLVTAGYLRAVPEDAITKSTETWQTEMETEPLTKDAPPGIRNVKSGAEGADSNGKAAPGANKDWGGDFSARLRQQALHWEMQLQPFVSEKLTPIEDASINWTSPYTTVARLTLPQQDTASAQGRALSEKAEASVFDPWQALAAHRPLGDVQRARKVVYFVSQKGRGAA